MPECPEVTILSEYLKLQLLNTSMSKINVMSGKYLHKNIIGKDLLNGSIKYKVIDVDSKGKVLYIKLKHNNGHYYLVSHLGMSGEWSLTESDTDRIRLTIFLENNNEIQLCYTDPRNFGNIEILTSIEFEKRINKLAPDVLKTNFTNSEFCDMVSSFLNKSKKRHAQLIFKVLSKQNLADGLFSGLGNYLIPEILYNAKISPYRQIASLSQNDLEHIAHSIKYITKMAYTNNITGYMANFKDFISHKKIINYHSDIILKKSDVFTFKVYQKNKDPLGNLVEKDKELNKGRTTHWVKTIQI